MDRRLFLKTLLLPPAISLLASPGALFANDIASPVLPKIITWPTDMRWLWLQRASTQEESKLIYYQNSAYHLPGYVDACKILRDPRAPRPLQVVQMDVLLLDLLFACQEWLRLNHILLPIQILSGYRTFQTNANTEGAAKNSMHMYGKAVDIRIPGIPLEYLVRLGKWFQTGGIGWYPHTSGGGFVHLDTGPVRQWVKP